MMEAAGSAGPEEEVEELHELVSFAELVAQTALSYVDEVGSEPPVTLVEQIVAGAVQIIPGTALAAVVNIDGDGLLQAPVAVGDSVSRALMQAQNEAGQGPCLDALRDAKQVVCDDLATDPRWPVFAALADQLGIKSMICTPMRAAGRVLGVLSLVSRDTEFVRAADSPMLATVFAAHAAIAMTGARRLDDINAALAHRDVIGQAKGVLMERFKVTPEVAFAMLIRTSSVTNLKLREVCNQLCLTGVLLPDPPRLPRIRKNP